MRMNDTMNDLMPLAETIAARLKARRESIAIAESSTGGLISAALLALPGASAYFLGGAVAYTRQSKLLLLGLDEAALAEFRPATEPHALLLARGAKARSPHPGACLKPAPPDRPGTATAIRPATLVLRLPAWSSGPLRLRPAAPIGSPTCMLLRVLHWSYWPMPYRCGNKPTSKTMIAR